MKKLLAIVSFCLIQIFCGHVNAAISEGKEYVRLATAQSPATDKIEVIEFFWYGCPHCYTVELLTQPWAKQLPSDVRFKREHVVWAGRPDMVRYAKIYYTLRAMEVTEQLQLAVFKAIQQTGVELRHESNLFDWVAQQGIDIDKFKAVYHSFAVQSQVLRAQHLTKQYKVNAVPSFIVNGEYITSPAQLKKADKTILNVLDELINIVRKQR